jgi:hypothetical protein
MIEIIDIFLVFSEGIMEDNICLSEYLVRLLGHSVNFMVCVKKHCENVLKNDCIKRQNWEQFTFTRVDLHITK